MERYRRQIRARNGRLRGSARRRGLDVGDMVSFGRDLLGGCQLHARPSELLLPLGRPVLAAGPGPFVADTGIHRTMHRAGGLGLPRVKRAPRRSSTPIGHPSSVSSVSTAPERFPSSIRRNNSAQLVAVRRGGRADGGHLGRALFKCCHEAVQGYSWAGPSAWTSTATTCPRHHPSTIFRERIGASRPPSATIGGRGRYG